MDATTHVRVAETDALPHTLLLDVVCDASGQHTVVVSVATHDGLESCVQFDQPEWSRFKGSVLAVDRAISQLRDKGLIFQFGPLHPEPVIPAPEKPGQYRITFVAEKMTSQGVETREFRDLAEMSGWLHGR